MSRPAFRNEDGFTVLELIVSLGLLALMTLFIGEGLLLVRQGGSTLEELERADTFRAVQTHIRRSLEGAVPTFDTQADGRMLVRFEGGADRLHFVARSSGALEGGHLVLLEFLVEENNGHKSLVETRRPADGAPSRIETYPLLKETGEVRFRYFGARTEAGPSEWLPEWRGRSALPRLVELTVIGPGAAGAPLIATIPAADALTN